ncbi:MAG: serine--tRNA ligase [Pseudolabrys sp.]|nr:serine--tRNA ligase [Pseudolabrys sp.]
MHDIKWIRENPDAFKRGLERRHLEAGAIYDELITLDEQRRANETFGQTAKARINKISAEIGAAKKSGDEVKVAELMEQVSRLKSDITKAAGQVADVQSSDLAKKLAEIPNLPAADVPDGKDEHDNVEKSRHGEKREYSFKPKEHFELGADLGMMDFELAAKLSGARFVVLQKGLARLERALGQFFLDTHTTEKGGYTEVNPPLLVRDDAMFGTAQLPKFEDDQFWAVSGEVFAGNTAAAEMKTARWGMIPTAEVPLTNLVREQIVDDDSLPRRYTACTPCFRAEAGAAGRDTRGMIRQHQFTKVELVSITKPEESAAEHERMLSCAEEVLKLLGLHYRVITLCTGDMGFASQKTYDIEVWLPGQNMYREISSCSVCGDFQARRMNARYRGKDGKPAFVHTLNGSGVAVGRALIAVMETYQQEDGSILVPEVLRPYMGGMTKIEKK